MNRFIPNFWQGCSANSKRYMLESGYNLTKFSKMFYFYYPPFYKINEYILKQNVKNGIVDESTNKNKNSQPQPPGKNPSPQIQLNGQQH